ncbi:MAG: AAA family ATPase, partial [Prevotellaceae bacterium]|nr:AAA family ATPase [Prevotellaceae bacterium]
MEQPVRFFPIGIQDFEDLRNSNCVYVDKTDLLYRLVKSSRTCFLSRPRRFGKSLMVSTLRAYFEGKKQLFEGLAMEKLEKDWTEHAVFHISFAKSKYPGDGVESLNQILSLHVSEWEKKYGRDEKETTFGGRFGGVVQRAYEQTKQQVVVLIDEYDSPILSAIGADQETKRTGLRDILRDFFSPLKDSGKYIRFLFFTGITKFSQLSIFSELNHLDNISMLEEYSSICGITETELLTQFEPDIAALAARNRETYDEACAHLKQMYDGYHFCEESEDIYNPYSIIKVLKNKRYDYYWYESGTPTFLVELMKSRHVIPQELEGYKALASSFDRAVETLTELFPVLYQSGYLTIKDYNQGVYTLGYPNDEVRFGFVNSLLPSYLGYTQEEGNVGIIAIKESLDTGDIDTCMKCMRAFVAGIPYEAKSDNESRAEVIFYII